MHNLHDKLIKVHDRLQRAAEQAHRDPKTIRLLAVSKKQPAHAIRTLFDLGQRRFGENYLQEALEKQSLLADLDIEWHFIGPIQSNKTRAIAEHFQWVHSVDRYKIAERLNAQRPDNQPPLNICLQVNIDAEPGKSGVGPDELRDLAAAVRELPRLNLRGLMAIPAPGNDYERQLEVFRRVRHSLVSLQQFLLQLESPHANTHSQLDTLSMGMSADLEAAVAAGATIVRIGTDLFGPRS